jgi:hypothetical protein
VHHEGHDAGGDHASQGVVRRDDVARIGIADGNPVDQARGGRIEDLAPEDRPAEGVRADLVAGQERAEVAALERVDGRRVAEAGQGARTEPGPVGVGEEEGLVLDDRAAQGGPVACCSAESHAEETLGVEASSARNP